MAFLRTWSVLVSAVSVTAIYFPFEITRLSTSDASTSPSLAFGNASIATPTYLGPQCKVVPGDASWPSDAEWVAFNTSLGGRLLKPIPPAAVCYSSHPSYNQSACNYLFNKAKDSRFYLSDPITVLTSWPEGLTCVAGLNVTGNCTQGGFPVYVVNATSVRDIQMAVNFARNKNLRLNIKNSGHDWNGRSTGYGSLSVWVHYLKGIEILPEYSVGRYKGPAARLGTGTESYEISNAMADAGNVTVAVPSYWSVAVAGGWSQGGGHNTLASLYGLGSDQILSLNVVTAEGKFVTADPTQNGDLFYALRGGGGSTFGIVTSAVFKAYPNATNLYGAGFALHTGPTKPGNVTTLRTSSPFSSNTTIANLPPDTFWAAYALYLSFSTTASAAGGFGFGDLNPLGNDSYTFAASFLLPGTSAPQATAILYPLFSHLRTSGVPLGDADPPTQSAPFPRRRDGTNDEPTSRMFASRLVPRAVLGGAEALNATVDAVRRALRAGLPIRCRNFTPGLRVAAYPGDSSAVTRAFRDSGMHMTVFEPAEIEAGTTAAEFHARHDVLARAMERIRAVTPGGGAYFNEADVMEPDWQESFFGEQYEKLLEVKRRVDPWGLFWAPTMVGSEAWEVQPADGLPTQNGKLCQTRK